MSKPFKLALLAFGHLLVDLCSVYLIFSYAERYSASFIAIYFILYNLIAFAFQPIVGYIADRTNAYHYFVIGGLLLPFVMLIVSFPVTLTIILATIGNAMYHVGGGVLASELYDNKATPLGLFVAPGAIGVFLGIQFAASLRVIQYYFIILVVVFITILLLLSTFYKRTSKLPHTPISKQLGTITVLLLIVIFIRGFIGFNTPLPWKNHVYLYALLVLGIALGKALGGYLGDRFSLDKIGIIGLLSSIPFFLFSDIPWSGIIGATLFNFTMAITLFYIIYSYGRYRGFAFGLTTLALFLSYLPYALGFHIEQGLLHTSISVLMPIIATILLRKINQLFIT